MISNVNVAIKTRKNLKGAALSEGETETSKISRLCGNEKMYAQEHKRMRIQLEHLRMLPNVDVCIKGRKRRKDAASVRSVNTNIKNVTPPRKQKNVCARTQTHAYTNGTLMHLIKR
jgi:hypothetical protein